MEKKYFIDCKPSKIWLLIRHGTRLPTVKGIKIFREMEKVYGIHFYFDSISNLFINV